MSKVWFITGAGRGFGAEIARAALREGDKIVATGRNLAQLRASFPEAPKDRIAFVELDVTCEEQAETAVQVAITRFGRIDVLVNNAGYGQMGNFEEVSSAAVEQQFATNVFGLMHVLRAVLPVMRQQRSGHIFNISSIGGVVGFNGAAIYCATKHAIEGLSAALDMEVSGLGIKVTAVAPGMFRTDFLDSSSVRYGNKTIADYSENGSVQDAYDPYNHQQPGDPAKLGAAVVYLAAMENPPKQFLAGSDAVSLATPALEKRLVEIRNFDALSRSTNGNF